MNCSWKLHISSTVYKSKQSKTALNKYVDFFTEGSNIMNSYFNQKQWFKVKNVLMMDLFQLLSSPDVNWWTGVVWITCGLLWCFYQLFGLSFWRHPFTAEHPLEAPVKKQNLPTSQYIFSKYSFMDKLLYGGCQYIAIKVKMLVIWYINIISVNKINFTNFVSIVHHYVGNKQGGVYIL